MTSEANVPQALAFDVYGTLVDVSAMSGALGPELAASWRRHQLEISWLLALMERYEDFAAVTAHALEAALAEARLELDPTRRAQLLDDLGRLPAYEEAPSALGRLSASGVELAVLSNGHPSMLERLLGHAGLLDRFSVVVSVDEVRTYKPSPRVYLHAAERLGREPGVVWLVSGNPFDCAGAKAAGLGVAKVERAPSFSYAFAEPPNLVVSSLTELAERLGA